MSLSIFRNTVAFSFNTRIDGPKFRVFLSVAHEGNEADYKFDWRNSVSMALGEYEVASIVDALHRFNTGNVPIESVMLHHEGDAPKEFRMGHPFEKESGKDDSKSKKSKKKDTDKIFIWMDEVKVVKGKAKGKKVGGLITLTKGEALFLERYLASSLDMYVSSLLNNDINYGKSYNGDEDEDEDEESYSNDDIPDEDEEAENEDIDDEDDDPFVD